MVAVAEGVAEAAVPARVAGCAGGLAGRGGLGGALWATAREARGHSRLGDRPSVVRVCGRLSNALAAITRTAGQHHGAVTGTRSL